jgi:hypothetical protein
VVRRARVFAVVALAALPLAGCKRGWLADWLKGHNATSEPPPAAAPFVNAVDCPDGLARCIGGVVEVSRVARVPQPCPPGAEKKTCTCPWDAVDKCDRGCAAEGAEVVAPPDRAAARVCASDPLNPVARPAPLAVAPSGACDDDGYRCVQSLVVACDEAEDAGWRARVVAACARGCVHEGESLREEEADFEGATRILCAR